MADLVAIGAVIAVVLIVFAYASSVWTRKPRCRIEPHRFSEHE